MALGDIDLHFASQAWHLVTWTWTLRGRPGTYGTGLALVALGSQLPPWTPRLFAWQAWHLVTWTCTLRGRRGTWWHGRALCVAELALMALGWLWWRAWVPVDAVDAAALCVAGVALGDINLHFAWQGWHLVTWTCTLRGRRGSWWHGSSLCVAGLALMALGWLWWRAWVPVDAVDAAAFGVAAAWHLVTCTCTLRGRRGTYGTGLALVARFRPSWRGGRRGFLHGRRKTWRHRAFCVAGAARGDMDVHFAWQAWHLWHWAGSGGALGSQLTPWAPRLFAWQAWHLATWTFTLRGRCGTYGIWWRATYSHTQLLTHTQLVHTQLVHAQLVHTQLTH